MSMHGVKIKKERRVPLQGLMGGRGAVKGLKGGGGGEGTKGMKRRYANVFEPDGEGGWSPITQTMTLNPYLVTPQES